MNTMANDRLEIGTAGVGPLLHLAEHLEIPLRDRNELLLAAGYAPNYPAADITSPEMSPVREALELMLRGHEPRPAVVFDGAWNLVMANDAASIFLEGIPPHVLQPVPNVARITLHPEGLARRMLNVDAVRTHLLQRLCRQYRTTADGRLAALIDEVEGYPGVEVHDVDHMAGVLPIVLDTPEGPVSYLSTVASFGSPTDVVVSELTIELFFPVDSPT